MLRDKSGWEPTANWPCCKAAGFRRCGAARTRRIFEWTSCHPAARAEFGWRQMGVCENLKRGIGRLIWEPILGPIGQSTTCTRTEKAVFGWRHLAADCFGMISNGEVLHLTSQNGLPTDFVRCVTEDREGNIWVGTEGGGLCRLKQSIFQTYGVKEGLASDQVMAVAEAQDGGLWIGTDGDGLDHWKDGKVQHYGLNEGFGKRPRVVGDSGSPRNCLGRHLGRNL